MADWPGSPVATMWVPNYPPLEGGEPAAIHWQQSLVNQQRVSEVQLTWSVSCTYYDNAWIDHGQGYFRARLSRLAEDGVWRQIDEREITLGTDNDSLTWVSTLTISATMEREIEQFLLSLFCESRNTFPSYSDESSYTFTAIQDRAYLGNFKLDYIPVSIVYSPPDQDMTASLTQSLEYGTRMTIGKSSGFQSATSTSLDIDILGIKVAGVDSSDSALGNTRTESGIEISYFRNTVLTADNQRAIGRAYWGPLGDLFVVAVNPRFAADRRADGTIFYSSTGVDQLIVTPAYKLLRPQGDPVIGSIPPQVRRRLLELDPFIHNLDQFFPDTGAPLSIASNPYADPTPGNRAEGLGRWWLNTGSELNYSIGDIRQLKSGEATEQQFQSTVTVDEGFKVNLFDVIGVGAQAGFSFGTTVGLQSSKETLARTSRTAACYLIRNQNERDLDAIEIYYDKLFSTLMFRRIPAQGPCIQGAVIGAAGARLTKLPVALVARDDAAVRHTVTNSDGSFSFLNLPAGSYDVVVGDSRRTVEIPEVAREDGDNGDDGDEALDGPDSTSMTGGLGPANCVQLEIDNVRNIIELGKSPIWELVTYLEIQSDRVRTLNEHIDRIFDHADVAYIAGQSIESMERHEQNAVIEWPKTPLDALGVIEPNDIERLHEAGVASLQDLWRRTQSQAETEALSGVTGISSEDLRKWHAAANARRASVANVGAPVQLPQGCLAWIFSLPWLRHLYRRREFRRSRTWSTLFGSPSSLVGTGESASGPVEL